MGIDETEPATAHLNVDRAPAAKDVYADRQGHPGDEVSALRIRRSEMPRRQVRTHQDHVAVGEPQVIKRARAGHKGYFDVDNAFSRRRRTWVLPVERVAGRLSAMRKTFQTIATLSVGIVAMIAGGQSGLEDNASAQAGAAVTQIPKFRAEGSWPKLPGKWIMAIVSSTWIDEQDHLWVLQRPNTLSAEEKPKAAPPVLEFDAQGNFIQAWGGPGAGYDWPETEHGIYIDPKGFVWIGGNGNDDQILKFTKAGKFVMQIGKGGQKKTNSDTKNLWEPADVFVYAKTNELFVADGYGNKRIIVFDADTGAFKRMWGAFGGT